MDAPARGTSPRLKRAPIWKRALASRPVLGVGGFLAASYLRLVYLTSSMTVDPVDAYELVDPKQPFIIAMWHGQHFMVPFIRRDYHRVKVLISRHRDGELNALAAERLGVGTIRGSGDMAGRFLKKGGFQAFRAMVNELDRGTNVALTADVPKVARRAGFGVVKLAAHSGRPILPVAVATSRRIELNNWDRTAINLPFSRAAVALGDWVHVSAGADDAALEAARLTVEAGLNEATERAYAMVDRRGNG